MHKLSVFLALFALFSVRAATTLTVGKDKTYETIQAAIDAANEITAPAMMI